MSRSFDVNKIRKEIGKRNISNEQLLKIYRKVAKISDQRLVRLEALSTKKDFKQVRQWAYKGAVMDAMQWGASTEKPRFNIKPPEHRTQLKAKINDMLNFLEKPTSTRGGIVEVYQRKADTLNQKYKEYGLNLNWSDVGTFFESALYKKLSKKYASGTVIKAIGTIKQNEKEVLKDFEDHKASHVKTEDNDIVIDDAIKRMTSYYKDDVKKLLNLI